MNMMESMVYLLQRFFLLNSNLGRGQPLMRAFFSSENGLFRRWIDESTHYKLYCSSSAPKYGGLTDLLNGVPWRVVATNSEKLCLLNN